MRFEIVTDTSSNLTDSTIDEFGLYILPLSFMVDGVQHQSYLKGEKSDLQRFYTMMREGKVITTSLPNLVDSEKLLRGLLEQGRDVLYLGFSSGLSGTYEALDLLIKSLQSLCMFPNPMRSGSAAMSSGTSKYSPGMEYIGIL